MGHSNKRRKIKMALLGLGALAGFAGGFASLSCHRARWGHHRLEERVTRICSEAMRRSDVASRADKR